MSSSVFSDVDEYGFKRPADFDYTQYDKFISVYNTILARRSLKWHNLLKDNKNVKRSSTLYRYVRKGVPLPHRRQVWLKISGVDELKIKYGYDLYYKSLNKTVDADVIQSIRTDLPRTYPENVFFDSSDGYLQQLYRILFACAADNVAIGYCLGLNYVAGLILIVTKSEEDTFWLLKALIQTILPDYYGRNMHGLVQDIKVFAVLIQRKMPELHKHVTSMNVPWLVLISKWFICLYAEVLPTETVLRIWDCLFYDYSRVLFRVGLTLISHYQQSLLTCDNLVSFVECFKNIPHDMFVLDCHAFMKKVNKENRFITNKEIEKLRKQVSKMNISL